MTLARSSALATSSTASVIRKSVMTSSSQTRSGRPNPLRMPDRRHQSKGVVASRTTRTDRQFWRGQLSAQGTTVALSKRALLANRRTSTHAPGLSSSGATTLTDAIGTHSVDAPFVIHT
jgi:hypothetical protein